MSIFLDLGIILLLLCFMVEGYKKGLIASLTSFFYTIFSFAVSVWASSFIADFVYSNWIKPSLILEIENSITTGRKDMGGIFNFLPSFLFNEINSQEIFKSDMNKLLQSGSGAASEAIAEAISPTIIYFLKFIIIMVLLTILAIIVKWLNKAVFRSFRIPVLSEIDGIFGIIFGIIKGIIVIIFLSVLLKISIIGFGYGGNSEILEIIDKTSIFKIFYNLSFWSTFPVRL